MLSLLKNNFKLVVALLLTINIWSFFLIINTMAQENSESSTQSNEIEQQIKPTTVTREKKSSILEAIWKLFKARKAEESMTLRSTSTAICPIGPSLFENAILIYSDRPLFIWQGKLKKVKINLYNSPFSLDTEQEIIWSKSINDEFQNIPYKNIPYTGKPLQPGKIYEWEIVTDYQSGRPISFKIMDAQERDIISKELAQLETELTTLDATKEEIILTKAKYFAEKGLWLDALQQLFSLGITLDNASIDNKKIRLDFCW